MVTPPPGRPQPNLAQGNLNYGAQQVQATVRGFGQLAGLLGQIAHLLSRTSATSTAPGASGFGGAATFGSAAGTQAQWVARAQQQARMAATAQGRIAQLGSQQDLDDAHAAARTRMQGQQAIFAQQWRNAHATEAARTNMSPEQAAQSQRRLGMANLYFQQRSQSFQQNMVTDERRYRDASARLDQQRRDLADQVRQGQQGRQQAVQAAQGARQLEGRRAAVGFGLNVAGRAVAGAASAVSNYYGADDYTAIGQFGRRMSLISPTQGGTAAQHTTAYGGFLSQYGLNNQDFGKGTADWVGGTESVIMQTAPAFRKAALKEAASNAFVSGSGVQAAATAQAELGSAQSFYAAQAFGLTPTRSAGGKQASLTDMAMSIADRVNRGGFANLSADELSKQLSQTGSLSTSLATVGQAAGWSGQTLDMMNYQLRAMRTLMNPGGGVKGMSQDEAQTKIAAAAGGDKGAIGDLKKAGLDLGSSYTDAQNLLTGKDREGHLATSASYLDAATSSANTLIDIKTLLQKALAPLAGMAGSLQGGGVVGAAASNPLVGSVLGGLLLGPSGVAGGAQFSHLMKGMGVGGGDAPISPAKQGAKATVTGAAVSLPTGSTGAVIGAAEAQLGKPYLWGGTGPDGWDCSGLTQAAYKQGAGIDLPRVSQDQAKAGVEVAMNALLPGDLVFPTKDAPPHVAMYIGNGNIIEAPRTGLNVREVPMGSRFTYARRVLGGAGSSATKASSDQSGAGAVASGSKTTSFTPVSSVGSYGSTSEVDALAAALAGGGGGAQGGTPPAATAPQDSTASGGTGTAHSSAASSSTGGTTDASGAKAIAKSLLASYGFGADQWDALDWIWTKESGWSSTADNPTSTAYGIPQALEYDPKSGTGYKMTGEYGDYHTNATTQIKWGLNYIKGRYGNPDKAKSFWEAHNWYDRGAWDVPNDQVAKLHAGEAVLTKAQATTMRQALMEGGTPGAGSAGGGGSVTLEFQPGSIVISMPSATSSGAQAAAQSFVSFVTADDRIKSLMGGW